MVLVQAVKQTRSAHHPCPTLQSICDTSSDLREGPVGRHCYVSVEETDSVA